MLSIASVIAAVGGARLLPSSHSQTVLRIVDWLTRHGLRGRADHIGHHRFQRKQQGLFVGRFRPDILLTEGGTKIIVEVVCPPVLRGGRLVDALSVYKGSGYTVIVVAPKEELQVLQDALSLMDLEPHLMISRLDVCCSSILSLIKDASDTVQTTLLQGQNEP